MKRFAQIIFILLLLLSAGKALALELYDGNGKGEHVQVNIDDNRIANASDAAILESIQHAVGRDLTAFVSEYYVRRTPQDLINGWNPLRWVWNDRTGYRNLWNHNDSSSTYYGRNPNGDIVTISPHPQPGKVVYQASNNQWNWGKSVGSIQVTSGTGVDAIDCPNALTSTEGFFCGLLKGVAKILLIIKDLFAWIARVGNMVFNWSIYFSVRNFDGMVNSEGLRLVWRLLRDLVNLSLIFVLLYVAIGTVLQLDRVNSKKIITSVITAALLVNFSFFFTGIAIDASNVIANQFYIMSAERDPNDPSGYKTSLGAPDIISQITKEYDGLNDSIYKEAKKATGTDSGSSVQQAAGFIAGAIGQIILLLITVFVLFAGAVMFLIRAIVLTFLLATSPVIYLAEAVGEGTLKGLAKDWWKHLMNQLLFAPTYLLFIYLTVQLTKQGLSTIVQGSNGFVGTLITFAIINGLMLGSLTAAQKLAGAGASVAVSSRGRLNRMGRGTIDWSRRFARQRTARVQGWVGSGLANVPFLDSVGGSLKKSASAEIDAAQSRIKSLNLSADALERRFRSGLTSTTDKMAIGNLLFDKNKNNAKKQAEILLGMSEGQRGGVWGGLSARNKAAVNAEMDKQEKGKNIEDKDLTSKQLMSKLDIEEQEKIKEAGEKAREAAKKGEEGAGNEAAKKAINDVADKLKNNSLSPEDRDALQRDAQDKLSAMANKDVVKLDVETLKVLAGLITDSQITALEKAEGITEQTMREIYDRREGPLKSALVSENQDRIREEIGKLSDGTIKEAVKRFDISGNDEAAKAKKANFDLLLQTLSEEKEGRDILEDAKKTKGMTYERRAMIRIAMDKTNKENTGNKDGASPGAQNVRSAAPTKTVNIPTTTNSAPKTIPKPNNTQPYDLMGEWNSTDWDKI